MKIEYIKPAVAKKKIIVAADRTITLNWRCPKCKSFLVINRPLAQFECWSCGKYIAVWPFPFKGYTMDDITAKYKLPSGGGDSK